MSVSSTNGSSVNEMYLGSQGSSSPAASCSIKSEKEKILETLSANPQSRPYPEHCFLIMSLFQRLVQIGETDLAHQFTEENKNSWHPRKLFAASQGMLRGSLTRPTTSEERKNL